MLRRAVKLTGCMIPKTKKIVVSRDVIFEESIAWKLSAEFVENSKFVVEEAVGVTAQPWTGGVAVGDNHDDHLVDNAGGAAEASGDIQTTGEVVGSVQQGTETQSVLFMVRQ